MIKVALRVYNRDIETLIDQGHTEEAVAHCMYILKSFPKHLESYRLLGKAFLEAHQYTEAADIFTRVLLAVPDDFVSHLGMSIIYDEKHDLAGAIWHMERAFEINSTNGGIQNELRRLYGRRDGVEPARIHLTRGALAQIYTKAGEFQQAIAEIKSLLAEDPDRNDMKSLLAKAYFQSGMKNEAVECCTGLLKTYIYNLEANRILAAILMGTNLVKELEQVQQRVHALDPYTAQAAPPFFNTMSVPDGAVMLEKLEWVPGRQSNEKWNITSDINKSKPVSTTAGEDQEISGENTEETAKPESAGNSSELPDWLKSVDPTAEAAVAEENSDSPDLTWLETPGDSTEDIIAEAGALEETTIIQEVPEISAAEEITVDEPLSAPSEETETVPVTLPVEDTITDLTDNQQPGGDLPEWLRNTEEIELPTPAETAVSDDFSAQAADEPVIDQPVEQILSEPVEIPVSAAEELTEQAADKADEDWFSSPQDDSEGLTLPPVPAANASDDDWFTSLDNQVENPVSDQAVNSPAGDGEIPDWLQELEAKTSNIEAVSISIQQLTAIDSNSDQSGESETAKEITSDRDNPNIPEWLKDLDFDSSEKQTAANLEETAFVSPAPEQVESASDEPGTSDIPDWLQGLDFTSNAAGENSAQDEALNKAEVQPDLTAEIDSEGDLADAILPDISLVLGTNIPSPDAAGSIELPEQNADNDKSPTPFDSGSSSWLDDLMSSTPGTQPTESNEDAQKIGSPDQALAWLDSLGQNENEASSTGEEQSLPVSNISESQPSSIFADMENAFTGDFQENDQAEEQDKAIEYPAWMGMAEEKLFTEPALYSEPAIEPGSTLPEAGEQAVEENPILQVEQTPMPAELTPEISQESQAETLSWLESLVQQDETNPVDLIKASPIQPAEIPAASVPSEAASKTETGEEIDPRDIPAELMETKPTRIKKISESSLSVPASPEAAASNEMPEWAKAAIPESQPIPQQPETPLVDDESFDWLGDLSKPQNVGSVEEDIPQAAPNTLSIDGKDLPEPPQISLDWVQGYSPHMHPADNGLVDSAPIQQDEILSDVNENISTTSHDQEVNIQGINPAELDQLEPAADIENNNPAGTPLSETIQTEWSANLPVENEAERPGSIPGNTDAAGSTDTDSPAAKFVDENAEKTKAWLESLGPEAEPVSFAPLPWVPAEIESEESAADEIPDETEENTPIPVDESSDWYETLKSAGSGKEAEPLEWSNPNNNSNLFSEEASPLLQNNPIPAGNDPFAKDDEEVPADETGDYFTIASPLVEDAGSSGNFNYGETQPQDLSLNDNEVPQIKENIEQVDIFETGNPDSPISVIEDELPEAAPAENEKTIISTPAVIETTMPAAPVDKDRQTLEKAREMLVRGKLPEAASEYSKLIKKAKLLDEIIYDLQQAVYRQPVDILTWQTLGDAYFRANRLQEALDAYGKAEGLLR